MILLVALLCSQVASIHVTTFMHDGTDGTCVAPDPAKARVDKLPCGGTTRMDGEEFVRIFQYGANMGCPKLDKLDVKPLSATPASIKRRCIHFGVGEDQKL